ncbi:MAG TPA: hypothetical protein VG897_08660, partial [Terriglobales bacterium]|nr:hypothetical protein [Terriglobales bacterium]
MIVGGIDPGKGGALAVLGTTVQVFPVPLFKFDKEKDKIDYPQLASEWMAALRNCDHVFIELVGAMPKNTPNGMFNFGYAAGAMYMLVLLSGVPHTFITPQKWKKVVGIAKGSDKEQSRRR